MTRFALALLLVAAQDSGSDAALKGWVEKLGALYETERRDARKALEAAGAGAEKALVAGLDHKDHRVRRGCLELLTPLDASSGVERACALFRSKTEDRAVQAAAFAYARRHAAKAEDFFIEGLDHPEETYRLGAVEALASMRSEKCLDRAAALFERETVKEIKDKVFELLQAGGAPARPHLLKLLRHADATVRQEALRVLVALETPPEELVEPVAKMLKLEVSGSILEMAFDIFGRAGDKATRHLLEGLKSPSEAVRRRALEAVMKEGSPSSFDGVAELYLREALDDLRATALDYLVQQGLRAEPVLIKALENPSAAIRMEAIPALGKIKSEKVYDRVAALFRSERNTKVREQCFEYLESVGIRAENELILALNDEDLAMRRRAMRALARAGSLKAIDPLIGIMADAKPEIRRDAVEALARIGDKSVESMKNAVAAKKATDADAAEVAALVDQLAVERVLDGMISEDGSTGTWPGQFEPLAKLGRDRCLPVLWRIITEPEYAVRFPESPSLPTRYALNLTCLAILAVGELGDAAAAAKLKALTFPAGEDLHREQLVALNRLGDKGPLEKFVAGELKDGRALLTGDDRVEGYRRLFNAALVQSRAGLREEALKTYVELTGAVDAAKQQGEYRNVSFAHYNMACLHAAAKRPAEAVAALTRAVDLGFQDFDWIRKDKELDPIRGEAGYKKLMEGK